MKDRTEALSPEDAQKEKDELADEMKKLQVGEGRPKANIRLGKYESQVTPFVYAACPDSVR